MLRWVFLCAVIALIRAQTTLVSQCPGGGDLLPYNIYVEGCTIPPCRVRRGAEAILHVIFRAPYLMQTMSSKAIAYVPGLSEPVNWDLGRDQFTCNFLSNGYCPVLEGEVLQYTLRMRIPLIAPPVTVTVEFIVTDGGQGAAEKDIMCVRLPVTVLF